MIGLLVLVAPFVLVWLLIVIYDEMTGAWDESQEASGKDGAADVR